jgi:hypothetical protein
MIPIKINKKKYKIKSVAELSTREFIELSHIDNLDMVKYIAWQTKTDTSKAFFAVTDNVIELAIGKVPDVATMHRPKWPNYSHTIETVGQRHQIESSGLSGYELLVFVLAVAQARSTNIDDVNTLRDQYMDRPYTEILPAGFFFYKNLLPGRKFAAKSLEKLMALIKTIRLRKMQAAKN